jgi:hypothetical protein
LAAESAGFEAAEVRDYHDTSRGNDSEHENYFEQRKATLLFWRYQPRIR